MLKLQRERYPSCNRCIRFLGASYLKFLLSVSVSSHCYKIYYKIRSYLLIESINECVEGY